MATTKITATVSGTPLTVTLKDGPDSIRTQLRGMVVSMLCNQQTALSELKIEES